MKTTLTLDKPKKGFHLSDKITDNIRRLLQRFPMLKDDDERLIANYWHYELKKQGIPESNTLKAYAEGKLTSAETIRRTRQKLQEAEPELRGKLYKKKKYKAEDVKAQMVGAHV